MKIEHHLEKLKREYKAILPSDLFVKNSWDDIEQLLGQQDKGFVGKSFSSFRFLTVPLLLVFLILGVVGASQAAIPGDVLYPVKRLSESVVFNIYQKPEIVTERRAKEVIEVIEKKKSGTTLKEAVQQYEKSIEEEKKKIIKESKEEAEFEERLERDREEFREVLRSSLEDVKGSFTEKEKIEPEDEDNDGKNEDLKRDNSGSGKRDESDRD